MGSRSLNMSAETTNEAFCLNHLPWTDTDFYGMKLVLDDWARKGFTGELDRTSADFGFVTLITSDLAPDEGSYDMIEFHKLKGKKVLFWQTTRWVARFFSCQSMSGAFPCMRGCIGAPTLIYALQKAARELSLGLLSVSELEDYYQVKTR